ncbi:MAG: response regulator, partial [Planctomycetota bacterium]|nr:response regulator [Planctomycetota bacterium]
MSPIAPCVGQLAVLIESGGEPIEATRPHSLSLVPVSNSESAVLIVGSDPSNVEQLMRYLQEGGWGRFLTATNHEDAIELVQRHRPDVWLYDLTSERSTATNLLKWRLADSRARLTPVIVVTPSSDPSEKIQAIEQGATDFLSRPVDPCELVFRIHNALGCTSAFAAQKGAAKRSIGDSGVY